MITKPLKLILFSLLLIAGCKKNATFQGITGCVYEYGTTKKLPNFYLELWSYNDQSLLFSGSHMVDSTFSDKNGYFSFNPRIPGLFTNGYFIIPSQVGYYTDHKYISLIGEYPYIVSVKAFAKATLKLKFLRRDTAIKSITLEAGWYDERGYNTGRRTWWRQGNFFSVKNDTSISIKARGNDYIHLIGTKYKDWNYTNSINYNDSFYCKPGEENFYTIDF